MHPALALINIPIDAALHPPLPNTNNDNLFDGLAIAKACGYSAAEKVAGTQQDKGKRKELTGQRMGNGKAHPGAEATRKCKCVVSEVEDHDDSVRHGCLREVGNYSPDHVVALLDFVEEELLLGQRGWQLIHRSYTRRSCNNGYPEHKPLETKFKQLVKVKKPTGDAHCPPDVK